VKAWDDLMLNGREPPAPKADCETPIADIARVGEEMHINGTPGLIFGNGKLVPGAIPAADIEKLLSGVGKS
jgi:thiol:disulfide interchange protein DsbC